MGDSDDDFDKRRGRDKFRRERPDYAPERRERGGWEEGRGRGDWRGKRDRESYHDYDRGGRGGGGFRNSPPRYGSPPQAKKIKRDWEDMDHGGGATWTPGDMGPPQSTAKGPADMDFPTQPPMMTFKSFLAQQDDNIMDEEAIRKFNEYKLDFKKQQINEFFLQHKEEEWFKDKYYPEDYDKHKVDSKKIVQLRCEVFSKLLSMGLLEKCSCDVDKSTDVVKLMDAAVILMEGGTDFDLQSLEEEYKFYQEEKMLTRQVSEPQPVAEKEKPVEKSEGEKAVAKETTSALSPGAAEQEGEDDDEGDGEIKDDEDEEGEEEKEKAEEQPKQDDPEPSAAAANEEETSATNADDAPQQNSVKENGLSGGGDKKKKKKEKQEDGEEDDDDSGSDSLSDSSESEAETLEKSGTEPPPPGLEGVNPDVYTPTAATAPKEASQVEEKEQDSTETVEEEGEPKPKPLHRTQSIFLRNLAPGITRTEIEALCKKYPGFLRLSLQDPAPERKFHRRGWATFNQRVNIKEICWNLTNIRLRDTELGAIVNRELKQRVRPVSGIVANRTVAKADIKHCAKIVQCYDKRWGLWEQQAEKKDQEKERPHFGLISNNPVLANITDYLVDEGSYEEEAYLGKSLDEPSREGNPEVPLDRDDELLRVLDRMILYLRVVHSFDYYSCIEYPNEDEMPHRCGIIHCRGPTPLNRITQGDIDDWVGSFERKILPLEDVKLTLTEDEARRLGLKDQESEVEKYIQANTQELAKDKWLCPLSGKKFKGPDFVRKHIQNKHGEKLVEVKHEVKYFNNYLMDPKRSQLPEHPANKHGGVPSQRPAPPGDGYGASPSTGGGMGEARGGGFQPPPYQHHQGSGGGYQGGGGGYNNYRGGPPMPYGNHRGHRGRGGPPSRGYQSNYNRGGYNNYHDKPDYRNRERSYDRNYQAQRRDRSRQDPRGIVEYRDLDALKEDSDTFFVLDES